MIILRPKLLASVSVIAVASYLAVSDAHAAVTSCVNLGASTIGTGNCTVAAGAIPTTISFDAGATGSLILNAAVPTAAVTNTTDGEGAVNVTGGATSAAAFGVATTGDLLSFTVSDGVTFALGHNLAAITTTVGAGTSGVLNQSAGTLTATTLAISAGGTLTQSGAGVINATNVTIGNGGALTLITQNTAGTVTIDGASAGQGALTFGAAYNTDAAIGATSLASVTVNDAVTLTLDQNLSATTVTVGSAAGTGVINQSAGTLTATTLVIGAADTFTQSGTGVINANTTIATGGALTVVNQGTGTIDGAGAGQGALTFGGNYNTDSVIGATTLATVAVNDGVTLTLDQNLSTATSVTVGQGASGVVNQSAGTLTTGTLAVAAGGTYTQSGTGAISATNTTIATGGTLTLTNQGSGTIQGAGANQGALVFAGDYNTDAALGGTQLASITVNSGSTLTLDQAATTASMVVNGTVTHSIGTLTPTTLSIASGGIFNQTGAGAITGATTIQDGGTMNVSNAFTHTGALVVGGGTSGTLDVAGVAVTETGTFEMKAGSTFKTTINTDAANASGTLTASGNLTIAAATTIDITVTPATLTDGQTYVILTGAGGTINVPTTITDNSSKYSFTASATATTLKLTVSAATAVYSGSVTSSSNASAAATIFDSLATTATGDMSTVITALDTLTGTALDTAIATTLPDTSGALATAGLSVQSQSLGVVTSRMAALRNGLSGTAESGISSGSAAKNSAMWGQAFGATAEQKYRKATDGYDVTTGGLAFGGDQLLDSKDWTVGAAYSYAVTNVNNKGANLGNGSDIKSHQGTLYASLDNGPYYVDVLGSVARNDNETNRQINVGSLNRVARGDFKSMQYSAKVGGGYNVDMGDGWTATPTASVQATRISIDGYTETGADALNLAIASQSYNHVQSGLGMKGTYTQDSGSNGETLTVSGHATWLYDVKSVRQETTSSYTGGGASFITQAANPARNAANVGASASYDLGTGVSVAASYDAEVKDQYLSHAATATARVKF